MKTAHSEAARGNGYSAVGATTGNVHAAVRPGDRLSESSSLRGLSAVAAASPFVAAQRKSLSDTFAGSVQRKTSPEKKLQGKFVPAQRLSPEKEKVQGKFAGAQRVEAGSGASSDSGLPGDLRSGIETLSGMSMDDVNVHYNSSKPAQLNALAYAQGSDIHLGPGQEKHLPHEAWHVVQQAQGRVRATGEAGGVAINDDSGLESEADSLGSRATQMKAPPSRRP